MRSGESLSLQLHNHRSEHWVVVRGVAVLSMKMSELKENQSCFIPEKTRQFTKQKQFDLK